MTKQGKVYLIGAGPGDPGLLSIKAMECLKAADAVVYDRLADPRILAYARPDAEMVYVAKPPPTIPCASRILTNCW